MTASAREGAHRRTARQADRAVYVRFAACGCPSGVMESTEAVDVADALSEFYDGIGSDVARAAQAGVTVRLMPFGEYHADVYPRMFGTCPHGGAR